MKPAIIILMAMVLTEVGTNIHAVFPPAFLGLDTVDGKIVERYDPTVIDPWTVRKVSLSLQSALMLFIFAWMKTDTHARNYMRAWGFYFLAQAAQVMAGVNIAESLKVNDWAFDAIIMLFCIGAAALVNRFQVRVVTNPLRVVWRR